MRIYTIAHFHLSFVCFHFETDNIGGQSHSLLLPPYTDLLGQCIWLGLELAMVDGYVGGTEMAAGVDTVKLNKVSRVLAV